MSNDFVSAEELKKRKADALKAQADQAAAEEAAQKAREQATYEAHLPILTTELRPYIRQIFQKTIALAMELAEPDRYSRTDTAKHLRIDPNELIIVDGRGYPPDNNYGGEYSLIGMEKVAPNWKLVHYVLLKLNMERRYHQETNPWGSEPAAVGAWQTVVEELTAELLPLGYRITFEYVARFEHWVGGDDDSEAIKYYTGPGCIIRIEW